MLDVHSSSSSDAPVLPKVPNTVDNSVKDKTECSLRWRQNMLWVSSMIRGQDVPLPALADRGWFLACLTKSRAKAVCIDPSLGVEAIGLWAQACQVAQKPLFLRIPANPYRPANQKPRAWAIKRGCDLAIALLLLVILSPLMLVLAGLIKAQDKGPILQGEWRVGKRGRMFQMLKFRTTVSSDRQAVQDMGILPTNLTMTALGSWLKRSHLDKLPLLLNVLRGDISLVGPHTFAIYETLTLPSELRARLHTLPGITGSLRQFAHFPATHPHIVARKDLHELRHWSLWKDLKKLTVATLQVLD
ncbi:heterocyst development glycosyltransferase HepC [Nodosilinea sp. E11]|uniref:heterocyst development glycosyltransferase HepC n=1 Tax=Nodosilinea sp. E11 TaxID=3037479 RepID=UPI002934D557|nr:heterocyst development glycosyltransferase HepC [Nodosilinea sp. E11]WOD39271.1 sugar transferase [Nodosilinea sp. E11]